MKITCLLENTTARPGLTPGHGLSLFIETRDRCLLFDTGPDNSFLANAGILGVDPARAEAVFISHGHYDHGGGIPSFQEINTTAPIFMTQRAMGDFYALSPGAPPRYIGLDRDAIDRSRCTFITADMTLSDSMMLFTGFSARGFIPGGNAALWAGTRDRAMVPDDFSHEMALLIQEGGTSLLLTGCAHSGIGNMLSTVLERSGLRQIGHVIGGFHLYNPSARVTEPGHRLDALAKELSAHPHTKFYTGHCTGPDAPARLKKIMGEALTTFSTGWQIEI
ncbi:MAG: MBL fold metallo-hydrolase [Desulfobacter sp.]|nr:MAG: MBL fold metallo-hydrolase [Desulfobacter sp.]